MVLATLLVQPLNLLILDEPTNHLDIQSRETLLAALQNFSGTVVLVSHDRHFLRCLVNRVFEIDRCMVKCVFTMVITNTTWKNPAGSIMRPERAIAVLFSIIIFGRGKWSC